MLAGIIILVGVAAVYLARFVMLTIALAAAFDENVEIDGRAKLAGTELIGPTVERHADTHTRPSSHCGQRGF